VQVHQMLVEWDEVIATKDLRLFEETSIPWYTPYAGIDGTDAKAQYESTLLFQETTASGWKTWDLSALTQKWVKGDAVNYGVIMWVAPAGGTSEDTDGKDLRFRSSEYTVFQNLWPKLEITYSTEAKTVYFLKDHLGSIRATVLDSIGAPVIGYDDYDPWGFPLAVVTELSNFANETGIEFDSVGYLSSLTGAEESAKQFNLSRIICQKVKS